MEWSLYFRSFLASFLFAVSGLFFLRLIFMRYEKTSQYVFLLWRRFGGAVVIISFLVPVLLNDRLLLTPTIFGLVIGSLAIFLFGIWDDMVKLGWKIQLLFQIALGGTLLAFGFRIFSFPVPFVGQVFFDSFSWGGVFGGAVLVLWIILNMNAMNWMDGIDGLLSGVSLVSFFVIFLLSLLPEVNQPAVGILSSALFGAVFGLFIFNVPPASFLAGTSGSFFIGFAIATLSVFSGTKMATALIVLLVPILDAVWVFFERLWSGASPFHGDFRHLHYRLRDIGWSDRRILLCYISCTAILGILALSTGSLGKTLTFLLASVFVLAFLRWVKRKTLFLQ